MQYLEDAQSCCSSMEFKKNYSYRIYKKHMCTYFYSDKIYIITFNLGQGDLIIVLITIQPSSNNISH